MNNLNEIFIINPKYSLRLDKNRPLFYNHVKGTLEEPWSGFIHPIYAVMLSMFDGKTSLNDVKKAIGRELDKDISVVSNIIDPLLENIESLVFKFDNFHFTLPEKVLVKKPKDWNSLIYDWKQFLIPKNELDLKTWRFNYPLDLLFMINTKCVTDCIYCYADRRVKMDCQIPIGRLKELIKEARKLEMRTFDMTGGELFLYKHWEEFLVQLLENGFYPYVSTKMPIDLEIIKKLKNLGITRLQISLDSIIEDEMISILNVTHDYYLKMKNTLINLEENDFEIYINSQITSINQSSMDQLLDFLLKFDNIKKINLGAVGFSIYKKKKENAYFKPNLYAIKNIEKNVNDLKEKFKTRVQLNFGGYSEKNDILNKNHEEKKSSFNQRAKCSANFYAFVILPDGQVTVCEELYWHPQFIIGDLKKQSIAEVWNGEKALKLYRIAREAIGKDSYCASAWYFTSESAYRFTSWSASFFV